jgi:hypothetical protein
VGSCRLAVVSVSASGRKAGDEGLDLFFPRPVLALVLVLGLFFSRRIPFGFSRWFVGLSDFQTLLVRSD